MSLLQAIGIEKSFGGVRALRGVDFELRPGEVHALVGENGAGKSTLIRILAGALQPDSGELRLEGSLLTGLTPHRARALGIRCVYQQPSLFPHLSVAENIALAREAEHGSAVIDWHDRRSRARQALARTGAAIDPDREVATLSMPEQQLVEIAKAIDGETRVLILDEPTACLSAPETEALFKLIADVKARGAGVIYISHRLEELARIADRVTVLRDGANVAVRQISGTSRPELIQLMVGRQLAAEFPATGASAGAPVLELRDTGCRAAGVRGISLTVHAGEIVGLAGLVGAGRTELANVIFGLTPADNGEIRWKGSPVVIDSPATARRLGIGYVHEDRRRVGVIPAMAVVHNVTLSILDRVSRSGFFDAARENVIAEDYRQKLGVKTDSLVSPVETLSGGNQQKVALAKWLATEPSLIVLDEPTQGVDVGAKAEVHRLIAGLASSGLAVLMISSDLTEILGLSDRVVVMSRGVISGQLAKSQATREAVLALALEGHSPEAKS